MTLYSLYSLWHYILPLSHCTCPENTLGTCHGIITPYYGLFCILVVSLISWQHFPSGPVAFQDNVSLLRERVVRPVQNKPCSNTLLLHSLLYRSFYFPSHSMPIGAVYLNKRYISHYHYPVGSRSNTLINKKQIM